LNVVFIFDSIENRIGTVIVLTARRRMDSVTPTTTYLIQTYTNAYDVAQANRTYPKRFFTRLVTYNRHPRVQYSKTGSAELVFLLSLSLFFFFFEYSIIKGRYYRNRVRELVSCAFDKTRLLNLLLNGPDGSLIFKWNIYLRLRITVRFELRRISRFSFLPKFIVIKTNNVHGTRTTLSSIRLARITRSIRRGGPLVIYLLDIEVFPVQWRG